MTTNNCAFRCFNPIDLIPDAWKIGELSSFYVFNPTITKISPDRFSMMYRLVAPLSEDRRLAVCQLDKNLSVIPGSVIPFSDMILFENEIDFEERALNWHADARYFWLENRLFVTWNDGSARPHNNQFMMEIDRDGFTPISPARLLQASRKRRSIEKNWMFFGTEAGNFCIYTTLPHDIMSVDLSTKSQVNCSPMFSTETNETYSKVFGEMRGGAQPIRLHDRFLCIAHSSYKLLDQKSYYACVAYEFSATAPFQILRISRKPIVLPRPEMLKQTEKKKLNPEAGSVVYPCGAVLDEEDVIISYGVDDEAAAIVRIPLAQITSQLEAVETTGRVSQRHTHPSAATQSYAVEPRVAIYWWDSRGKSFDHTLGSRKFSVGNFGDIASRSIVESIIGQATRNSLAAYSPKLLAVGSVLHNADDGDVIWGSGAKGTKRVLSDRIKSLDVRAVRGPLTAEVLRSHGIDLSKLTHLFDPGCLIRHLWRSQLESYELSQNSFRGHLRIVPHYRDDLMLRRLHPKFVDSILSVDDTPLGLAQKMLGAEVVISSSLHGIIFAEALGIPAYWLRPLGGEDHFKYYDYYYGTGRYNVFPYDSVSDALAAIPQRLPNFDVSAYLETFPHDRLNALYVSGISPESTISLSGRLKNEINEYINVDWENASHCSRGILLKGDSCTIGVPLTKRGWQPSILRMKFLRNQESSKPFRFSLKVSGGVEHDVEWLDDHYGDRLVDVYLSEAYTGHEIKLVITGMDGKRMEREVILNEISVLALNDFEKSGFNILSKVEVRDSELAADTGRAYFDESPTEWVLNLERLPNICGFSRKSGERYARLKNSSKLLVCRSIVENSSVLFLTGPFSNESHKISKISVRFGKAFLETSIHIDPINNQWVFKIHTDCIQLENTENIELEFDLMETTSSGVAVRRRGSFLRFRKFAFSKRR